MFKHRSTLFLGDNTVFFWVRDYTIIGMPHLPSQSGRRLFWFQIVEPLLHTALLLTGGAPDLHFPLIKLMDCSSNFWQIRKSENNCKFTVFILSFVSHIFVTWIFLILCYMLVQTRRHCGHNKAVWDNHYTCLSCSFCSRFNTCEVYKIWNIDIWSKAKKRWKYKP